MSVLCTKLTGLRDPGHDAEPIHEAVASEAVCTGPYVAAAPDLIIGYNPGYRVAWDAAVGKCGPDVFSDNTNVDWSETQLYGLGLNGLYVKLKGRERHPRSRQRPEKNLLNEIRDKLMEVRDGDGSPVIGAVELVSDRFPNADPQVAPDLIVGYGNGYRASWATVLGQMPRADRRQHGSLEWYARDRAGRGSGGSWCPTTGWSPTGLPSPMSPSRFSANLEMTNRAV